ncbi:MAG: magnesium transporter CorA family protein [Firmicutes bacterium]|nr:magnesium transporter CorA family protein [Bacillota bacterium]MBQ3199607.1 magnesium transporter CorA family protein [Bacillota bacterium]
MLTIYRTPMEGAAETVTPLMQQVGTMQKGDWINLVDPTPEEIRLVSAQTGIAEEFIRYPLDDEELARVETDDGQILIIVNVPVITGSAVLYDTVPLGIVLNDEYIVTVSLNELDLYRNFSGGRVKSAATFKKTRLILQILQMQTNIYLKSLRDINRRYEALEARLRQAMNNDDLNSLLNLQKSLVYFTTSLRSNDKVMEKLFRTRTIRMYEEDRDLLDDVIIENKQAVEMADIYTTILRNSMDALASISNNNLSKVMNFLTVITLIVAVPTFITSFFGMNVPMPMADNPFTTLTVLVVCVVASLLCFFLLRQMNSYNKWH